METAPPTTSETAPLPPDERSRHRRSFERGGFGRKSTDDMEPSRAPEETREDGRAGLRNGEPRDQTLLRAGRADLRGRRLDRHAAPPAGGQEALGDPRREAASDCPDPPVRAHEPPDASRRGDRVAPPARPRPRSPSRLASGRFARKPEGRGAILRSPPAAPRRPSQAGRHARGSPPRGPSRPGRPARCPSSRGSSPRDRTSRSRARGTSSRQ
jgi:hypothetical protein